MFNNQFLQGAQYPRNDKNYNKLVLMLHGYGSNGDDLIELAPYISQKFPESIFISPNAAEPCEMGGFGYQWFSLENRNEDFMYNLLENLRPKFEDYFEKLLDDHKITPENVYVIGFSQGTMTALHMMPRYKQKIGGIIGFSGSLIAPKYLREDVTSQPNTTLIHGKLDEVVPYQKTIIAAEKLQKLGFNATYHLINNLQHSIDGQGIEIATNFLNNKN